MEQGHGVAVGVPAPSPSVDVLIVEGSAPAQRRAQESLDGTGMAAAGICSVPTIGGALDVLATSAVGCVLFDPEPGPTALEGVAALAAAAPSTPIVVVSDCADAEGFAYAVLAHGADEHVSRPDVGTGRLGRAICRALERRRGADRTRRAASMEEHPLRLPSGADLAFLAFHDPLTGLPNRRRLVDQLDSAVARGARRSTLTAVLFVDVDDFKAINDVLGHAAADEVLRTVAELISGVARQGDMVARFGGDEFVVCCEDVRDVADARAVAERTLQVLRAPFRHGAHLFSVTASIGVAVSSTNGGGEALLRHADAAMYAAKQAGKGRVEVFDEALYDDVRRRRGIARELARAIESGALVTSFQPQVLLATGTLFGFEALSLWEHPERGLVPPERFMRIAEESGAILRLGARVLDDACRALATWLELAPGHRVVVSVNVSARELADPELAGRVRAAIATAGVPADRICLEVPGAALLDLPAAAAAVRELRRIGVTLTVDDLGTGSSSLRRLRRLPVDLLAIHRELVAGIGRDADDDAVVSATVAAARSLGLRLVALGVGREEQLAVLSGLGCDLARGPLWGGALPLDQATALVLAGRDHPVRTVASR